jgi:hypothetical protein
MGTDKPRWSDIDRDSIQGSLMHKAATDPAFKQELIADPRGALQRALGAQLPEKIKISVLEETPEQFYIVLPPAALFPSGELADAELEMVVAGKAPKPIPAPLPPTPPKCCGLCMGTTTNAPK